MHGSVYSYQEMSAFFGKLFHFLLLSGLISFKHQLRIKIKHLGNGLNNRQPFVRKHMLEMGCGEIQIKHVGSQIPLCR